MASRDVINSHTPSVARMINLSEFVSSQTLQLSIISDIYRISGSGVTPTATPTLSPMALDIANPGYISFLTKTRCEESPSSLLTSPPDASIRDLSLGIVGL